MARNEETHEMGSFAYVCALSVKGSKEDKLDVKEVKKTNNH